MAGLGTASRENTPDMALDIPAGDIGARNIAAGNIAAGNTVAGNTVAGRYRLLAILGRGGMAQVWSGTDERLGRAVAIKTLTLDPLDSAAGARFRREASTTAGLSHPNIVTVFDYGVEQSTAFLVMELLSGPTLAARLTAGGPLSVTETTRVGLAVASALAAAHRAGVISPRHQAGEHRIRR